VICPGKIGLQLDLPPVFIDLFLALAEIAQGNVPVTSFYYSYHSHFKRSQQTKKATK
jgi:hypothetical protein